MELESKKYQKRMIAIIVILIISTILGIIAEKEVRKRAEELDSTVETIRATTEEDYEKAREEVREHLQENDFTRLSMLKLSAFLHDIGKPQTWTIEGDRHRFIKHDDVGSKLCIPLLKKLNFSKKAAQLSGFFSKHSLQRIRPAIGQIHFIAIHRNW